MKLFAAVTILVFITLVAAIAEVGIKEGLDAPSYRLSASFAADAKEKEIQAVQAMKTLCPDLDVSIVKNGSKTTEVWLENAADPSFKRVMHGLGTTCNGLVTFVTRNVPGGASFCKKCPPTVPAKTPTVPAKSAK
jgi:hypothetical protein